LPKQLFNLPARAEPVPEQKIEITAGSDVTVETADVAVLGDDLAKVEYSISLSRNAFRRMKLNSAFAMVWNVVGLSLLSLASNQVEAGR
jgi:cation transport ATPase